MAWPLLQQPAALADNMLITECELLAARPELARTIDGQITDTYALTMLTIVLSPHPLNKSCN